MKTPPKSSQQSLDRALELLEMLTKTGTSMNIAEISKTFKITRTTVSSMLQSLLQRNFIEKDSETGKYSIGYKPYEMALAYRYQYPFLYAAGEHINKMVEKLKVKINVSVLKPSGVAVVILSKDISVLPKMILGYVLPGYASASGKLLMAYAPREIVEQWVDQTEFIPYTQHTITNKNTLFEQLDQIRAKGVSYEFEELMLQRCCVAVPIFNISGQVIASVSFSVSKELMDANMSTLTENVALLGNNISSTLGYSPIMFR